MPSVHGRAMNGSDYQSSAPKLAALESQVSVACHQPRQECALGGLRSCCSIKHCYATIFAAKFQVRAAELARDAANDALLKAESRAARAEADARRCAALEVDLKVRLYLFSCSGSPMCALALCLRTYLMCSQETRGRMEICLELIGERNERIEELEDNVAEMKLIFRSQLSLAADQLSAAAMQAKG